MTNDEDLELIARRSASAVRDEARRIADTDQAWRRLITAQPPADLGDQMAGATSTVGLEPTHASPDRRPWLLAAAAAVVAVFVAGFVLLDRGDDGSIAPADTAPITEPTTVRSSVPGSTLPGSTLVPTEPAVPTTTVPPQEVSADLAAVAVDNPDPPVGEELYRAEIGRAANQLGTADQECDTCAMPWGPLVTSDGRIVIADRANARWVVVTDGTPSAVAFPDRRLVVGQPVIDDADMIYFPTVADDTDSPAGELMVADADDLSTILFDVAFDPVEDGLPRDVEVVLRDGNVFVDGAVQQPLTGRVTTAPTPSIELTDDADGGTAAIVEWDGVRRTWHLGTGSFETAAHADRLTDGTALVVDVERQQLVALLADGRAVRQALPADELIAGTAYGRPDDSLRGGIGVLAHDSLIRLEWDEAQMFVRRYPLPQPPLADPLAGVVMPEFEAPSLDAVPRLVPSDVSALGGATLVRRESVGEPASVPTHSQLWVRAGADGVVTGSVSITTQTVGTYSVGPATPIEVPGRPAAYEPQMDPSANVIQISMPSETGGGVSVRTSGMALDDTVRIASEMAWDSSTGGWTSAYVDGDEWQPIESAWAPGFAGRTVLDRSPDGDGPSAIELTIATGAPIGVMGLSPEQGFVRLVDVGGAPALLYEDATRPAIEWAPAPGQSVLIGSLELDADQLLAFARSLTEVDQPAWEAFAPLDTVSADGCSGLFC